MVAQLKKAMTAKVLSWGPRPSKRSLPSFRGWLNCNETYLAEIKH